MNRHTRVRNIMTTPVTTVQASDSPSTVVGIFDKEAFHHLPVLDGDTLVGMVSELDMARVSLKAWVRDGGTDACWMDSQFKLADLMTHEPEFVYADDPLQTAADKLAEGGFHALPVLEQDGRLVGMLTTTDLVRRLTLP